MRNIERFGQLGGMMAKEPSYGDWVRYTDHVAEVERLTVERDAAYISIESLRNALAEQDHELDMAREDVLRLTSERDAARAELAAQDHKLGVVQEGVERLTAERDNAQAVATVAFSALTRALRDVC